MAKCQHCGQRMFYTQKVVDEEKFIELVNSNTEPKQIAHIMDINISTVYKHLEKLGAKMVYRIIDDRK